MIVCGRLAARGEELDFPFWDGCFRLIQAGKSDKKTSKKLHFFWKKVLRSGFRAVDELANGATCSAALIPFTDYDGSRPVCRRRQGVKMEVR
ncbi:hypothetical protein BTE54_12525 [Agrobacterium sp. YIC 4121]|nr:hypothetical protein BTE54_12525 [Agrobacterium sp. YIC 4121]CUX13301.1 hypothetical protein AGR7B_Cc140018 [Agrobacterium deltaense RV3]